MPIITHKGDLFTDSRKMFQDGNIILCHGVNCAGAMGAGVAVGFKKSFPEMYLAYKNQCKNGLLIPGAVWHWTEVGNQPFYDKNGCLVERETIYHIYNLAIKSHWRLPATYAAVEASLFNLVELLESKGDKAVAMPWIGCGLGGLSKVHVQKIMEKILKRRDITFHVYEL